MSNGNSQPDVRVERIDADAVCAQCGTVNPEETLLCKTCGNNLRDQRARRVVGGLTPEALAEPRGISPLTKLLTLLGILLVVWVFVNIKRIESGMVGIQTADSDADIYWSYSPDEGAYEEMLGALRDNPVTEDDAARAQQPIINDSGAMDGRYVLMASNVMNHKYVVGQANVRTTTDGLLFVGLLSNADCEIRGKAILEAGTRITARDTIGLKINGKYYGASGLASKVEGGGYECAGINDYDNQIWSVTAYKIPSY